MLDNNHADIIYPDVLDQRIEALKKSLPDYDGQHIVPDDFFDEDDRDEYEALTQFRDDVISECFSDTAWTGSSGFIADSYFAEYAYNAATDEAGKAVVDSPYWDQDAYEDDQRAGFIEIDLGGVTYLIDRER
jgi:hypothetical protein